MSYNPILTMILLVAVVPLSGCIGAGIGWPTPEFGLVSGKGKISDETVSTLSHSDTTLEQALLSLGAPSRTIEENENILVYDWQTNQNFGAAVAAGAIATPGPVGVGGSGAGGGAGYGVASHIVLLYFDEQLTLTRLDHIKFYDGFTLPQEDIEYWASGASLCSNVYEESGTEFTAYCLHRFTKGE